MPTYYLGFVLYKQGAGLSYWEVDEKRKLSKSSAVEWRDFELCNARNLGLTILIISLSSLNILIYKMGTLIILFSSVIRIK